MELTNDIQTSRPIVLASKLGFVSSEAALDQALRAITDFGPISKRTGEAFSCRTWMKDSIVTLHDRGIVTLPTDIGEFYPPNLWLDVPLMKWLKIRLRRGLLMKRPYWSPVSNREQVV